MNENILDYLTSLNINPVPLGNDLITYKIGQTGLVSTSTLFTTNDLDNIYNQFTKLNLDQVIIITVEDQSQILIDYGLRRKIIFISSDKLNQSEYLFTPIATSNNLNSNSLNTTTTVSNNQSTPTESHPKSYFRSKTSERYYKQKMKQDENAKQSKKKRNQLLALTAIIIIFLGPLIITTIKNDISDYMIANGYKSMEVVENYQVDSADFIDLPYYNYKLTDAINQQPTSTHDYTFNETNSPLSDNTLTLESGVDFEPGVYTISVAGDISVEVENGFNNIYIDPYIESFVNVSLPVGSKLVLSSASPVSYFYVNLESQSEYLEYSDENSGVYVYGQSYFEPSQTVYSGYSAITFYYPYQQSFYAEGFLKENGGYQHIPGIPGSYFTVRA